MNTTIIYGGPGTGKTQKAKQLSKNKITSYIDYISSNFGGSTFMGGVDPDCQFLIIDDCPDNADYTNYLNKTRGGFLLNRKGKDFVQIDPEIILVTQNKPKVDLTQFRNVRLLEIQ